MDKINLMNIRPLLVAKVFQIFLAIAKILKNYNYH